jgi:hypothetical protein
MKIKEITSILNESPQVGDAVFIEAGETLIETEIEDVLEDGVLLKLDESAIKILSESSFFSRFFANIADKASKHAGSVGIESTAYIATINALTDREWRTIHSMVGDKDMHVIINALRWLASTPNVQDTPEFKKGAQSAINDYNSDDDKLVQIAVKSHCEKIKNSVEYLLEGWRGNLAGLGVIGALATGAALSPSTTVNGVKHYISPTAPTGADAKIVTDDNGKQVYVWKYRDRARNRSEMRYYPVDRVNEAKYQGREVPLGKPMKGDVKKSKVYVKNASGNVVKVNFGDKNMKIKKSNPKRRKSFRARHNCANPGPRWKARYWSCRAW